MLEYAIIGFLTLLVGLTSLFVDPKTDKTKAALVVCALVASAFATGMFGYYDSKDSKSQADKLVDISQKALDKETKMEASNASMEADLHTLMRRQNIPVNEGDVTSQPAASAAPSAPASRPIIEYFAKETEGDGVTKALRDGGLDVIKLPGQLPGPTNSVWAGNSVTIAEVRPVALALLRAGIQLKAVRHFRDGSGPKDRLIEIGSDHAFANAPVLTEEQIQNMPVLPAR
jgi:hypothetical protein